MSDPRAPDVLVIENDERISELLAWFLERHGHRVRCAPSFEVAEELLVEARPACVISDVGVGARSATRELPRLHRLGLLPATIIASGNLTPENERLLRAVPVVVDLVRKPYRFEELERSLRRVLAGGAPSGGPEHHPSAPTPAGGAGNR